MVKVVLNGKIQPLPTVTIRWHPIIDIRYSLLKMSNIVWKVSSREWYIKLSVTSPSAPFPCNKVPWLQDEKKLEFQLYYSAFSLNFRIQNYGHTNQGNQRKVHIPSVAIWTRRRTSVRVDHISISTFIVYPYAALFMLYATMHWWWRETCFFLSPSMTS